VVNSIPALIEELYLQRATTRALDLIQSIHNAFHPDVFAHSNILMVRIQGDSQGAGAVMEQISCSVSSTVLGITLPKCTNCSEDIFVSATIPGNQAQIWCVRCGYGGQSTLPPKLVYPKIKGSVCSVLPYPLPQFLCDELQIEWPKILQKRRTKMDNIIAGATDSNGQISQKVD
jgi:hypothetical protein